MKSYSKNPKIKKFVDKVKNEFKNFFSPHMELACAGVPIKILQNEVEDEKTKNLIFHHTGPYPGKGTQREIMEKKEIRILDGSYDVTGRDIADYITPIQAKKELDKLLKANKAAHEHIAFEATKMFSNPEVERYTLQIVTGAKAEDYHFMPDETLEDLYAKPPERKYKDDKHFVEEENIEPHEKRSFLKRTFRFLSRVAERFTRNIDRDIINRPYMSHFYDPSREKGDRGLDVRDGKIKFVDAASRAKKLWVLAVESYGKNEKGKAYTYLGHFIHLVSDMHVPAHVHNDIHAPWPIDKKDSYEEWCGRSDYAHLRRKKNRVNVSIWKASSLDKPKGSFNWKLNNDLDDKIEQYFEKIAKRTKRYRSVDFPGTLESENKTGNLTDKECYEQAKILVPKAIINSAQVIINFLDAIEEYKKK